jgi:hypothetical protein
MKKYVYLMGLFGCLLNIGCMHGGDSRLHGTWRSDATRSMTWNREHVELTPEQESFLSQVFGHMTVTYAADGTGFVTMDPYTLEIGDDVNSIPGFAAPMTYKVLRATKDSITIKTMSDFTEDIIATIYFDGNHAYWLYLDEDAPATSGREFYQRIK